MKLPPPPDRWRIEIANAERINAIASFGFTERQARFLVNVLVHSGVFVERQYCAFAGIVHGQKSTDFIRTLVDRRFATPIATGKLHRGRMFHVHYKPLWAAVGEPDNRFRKPAAPGRMIERVMLLDAVLDEPACTWLGPAIDKRRHFMRHLESRLDTREYPHLTFGDGPDKTVRYFPDKLPIGVLPELDHHVFVYLVTSPSPMDFRLFLLRHVALFRVLFRWTIRLLFPRPLWKARLVYQHAAREHLATRLEPSNIEVLEWLFPERKRLAEPFRARGVAGMSLWKRGRQYWTDFTVAGRRYRKRLGTTNLRVATRRERELIEEAGHGRLPADEQGPKRLSDAINSYLAAKRIRCSPRTIELEEERLSIVKKHFGDVPLSAITATTIADFQRARHDAGIANRTINMDVGVLSRVLKFCGRWRALADHVQNLPERQRPIGRALTAEERRRLFDTAASNPEWEHVYCAAIVAANTSMRPVEVKHIRRCDVDLVKRLVHVRRSKNETSHRVIPLNASAIEAAARMFERADLLGHTEPEHYLWPACQWGRYDPTKPMLKWDTAWRALRDAAGLPGLRFHDLRHTVITELAEMGVADHVLESISGHLSRRMLEHYSHIRIDAKRQALDALDAARRATAGNGNGNREPASEAEIQAIVEVGDGLTSQSRHSLLLSGSPPSGKLLIPLERR